MEPVVHERRRSPRIATRSHEMVGRPISMAVQMLDLSSGGLLLACPQQLVPGAMLRVTAHISGRQLDAQLDVRHVSNQWDRHVKGYRVGGRFISLAPTVQGAIDDLLGEGGS